MKTLKSYLLVVFLLFAGFIANAQPAATDISKKISSTIQDGNSQELAKYFNNTLDVILPEKEGTFSKTQAEQVVKDFFDKNKPKSFIISNQGSTTNKGTHFTIGTLTSTSGESFRTYFVIKKFNGSYLIQLLQFESE